MVIWLILLALYSYISVHAIVPWQWLRMLFQRPGEDSYRDMTPGPIPPLESFFSYYVVSKDDTLIPEETTLSSTEVKNLML